MTVSHPGFLCSVIHHGWVFRNPDFETISSLSFQEEEDKGCHRNQGEKLSSLWKREDGRDFWKSLLQTDKLIAFFKSLDSRQQPSVFLLTMGRKP
jgi:hypothetical protein